ncbi:MAG: 5'/3'-nucleotidase SurE [Candidatus Eisenbacteria bacterium]|nr:5'/3'-nucleotidase SurE [Candidatus Eisenbacteria bacterium]
MRQILITNDDGIHAAGLLALREALLPFGRVVVVAPDREMSASSHSITLHKPLHMRKIDEDIWSSDGTPTDCMLLAVHGIMKERPDIVFAGINSGPNMGNDVSYSGTVAAALEGAIIGIPSVAISVAAWENCRFDYAAQFATKLAALTLEKQIPPRTVLNVNVPNVPGNEIRGVKITKLGRRVYRDTIVERTDPRGKAYYWIGGENPIWEEEDDSDFTVVKSNMVSITPLKLDLTDYKNMHELEDWKAGLWQSVKKL